MGVVTVLHLLHFENVHLLFDLENTFNLNVLTSYSVSFFSKSKFSILFSLYEEEFFANIK